MILSSKLALTQYASKSKVTKFDDRVLCYQDVFWLYISVDTLETEKNKVRSKYFTRPSDTEPLHSATHPLHIVP